jgi:nucleoside-diphosphate-sugar epimerase
MTISIKKRVVLVVAVFVTAYAVIARGDNVHDDASQKSTRAKDESSYSSGSGSFPEITGDSTILITGAAGFLGSQLAMTLVQLYHPKQLLLVDNFDSPFFGSQANAGAAFSPQEFQYQMEQSMAQRSQSQMALLEYKRQRMFTVLQACLLDNDMARTEQRTQCNFFKADVRPTIPEFFDIGEVPLFDTIFDQYDNITHVVHLADSNDVGKDGLPSSVTGYKRDQTKSGLLETILEQVYKENGRRSRRSASTDADAEPLVRLPVQLVIASSFEVYDAPTLSSEYKNEDDKLTLPISFTGTSKVLQELLATTYALAYKVPSIALRFWPVYGPWDTPQLPTSVFEWMERALRNDYNEGESADSHVPFKLKNDWVYISDAINAVLSAMQLKLPPDAHEFSPLVFNVGGDGTPESPGELNSVARPLDMFHIAENLLKEKDEAFKLDASADAEAPRIMSDNTRAKKYLGYSPKVSLEEGIKRTLGWHVDRLAPYGSLDIDEPQSSRQKQNPLPLSAIRSHCVSPLDKECLLGTAVFPCVSECAQKVDVAAAAHDDQKMCYPTIYDGVVEQTRRLTQGCDVVVYTVSLGHEVSEIPNAFVASTPSSSSTKHNCHLAFISANGKLLLDNSEIITSSGRYSTHGIWTLVPVPDTPSGDDMPNIISLAAQSVIPKLTPGKFFDQGVSYAVYVEPHIVISNLENLILKMKEDPKAAQMVGDENEKATGADESTFTSATALMLSQIDWNDAPHHMILDHVNAAQQMAAYQSIQIGLQGQLRNVPSLDVSWMVHALKNVEDARLFRCDMYAELLQWGSFHSPHGHAKGMEFVTGLHDLWSRLIRQWAGAKPWWDEESDDDGDEGTESPDAESETTDPKNPGEENQPDPVLDDTDDESLVSKEMIMGVLSSKSTHQFVRVLPSDCGLTIALDKSSTASTA